MKRRMIKFCILFSAIMLMICIYSFIENPVLVQAKVSTPKAPTSVKAVATDNSITVSWSGVKGAKGYSVYRASKNTGTYTLLSTTTSKSYKNIKLTTAKTYYYKVRAYVISGSKKSYGEYSYVVNATVLPSSPASVKALSSTYNSIALSWDSVAGANGYAVYKASSSSSTYSLITTTTSKTYVNAELTTGQTYYYKIRAYITSGNTKKYGKYSSVVSAKAIPAAPSSVKASVSSYDSITISWDDVPGVNGYKVYVSTSSKGTYSLISDTTEKSYVNTGLNTGTVYYYKVQAYTSVGSSKVDGVYSSIINKTPILSSPVTVKAEATSYDKIDISWDEVEGASGYDLYRSQASSGTYKLVTTGSDKIYNDKELEAGTTYYYKVKAYRLVDSKKTYSNFSSAANATTVKYIGVTQVSLSKSSYSLSLGKSYTLKASLTPANATNQAVTWETSDSSVATVDNKGKIISVSTGSAIITVTTSDGNLKANCTVSVVEADIKGIDVSKWQGNIDWDKVAGSGIKFAMMRSSYGSSSIDPNFEANYAGAKASGVAVGVYHYSYATTTAKAATEVKFLLNTLKGKQFEYPICIDIEDKSLSSLSKKTLTDIVLVYLEALTKAGYYPMVYANKSWFTSKLDDTRLAGYDHWLAQWSTKITYTGKVGIWQYSDKGSISGISGRVDLDISFVDYAALIKQLKLNGY